MGGDHSNIADRYRQIVKEALALPGPEEEDTEWGQLNMNFHFMCDAIFDEIKHFEEHACINEKNWKHYKNIYKKFGDFLIYLEDTVHSFNENQSELAKRDLRNKPYTDQGISDNDADTINGMQ